MYALLLPVTCYDSGSRGALPHKIQFGHPSTPKIPDSLVLDILQRVNCIADSLHCTPLLISGRRVHGISPRGDSKAMPRRSISRSFLGLWVGDSILRRSPVEVGSGGAQERCAHGNDIFKRFTARPDSTTAYAATRTTPKTGHQAQCTQRMRKVRTTRSKGKDRRYYRSDYCFGCSTPQCACPATCMGAKHF